jgi:hypothetical protein
MIVQEQVMSIASSNQPAATEGGLSTSFSAVELVNAVTSAIPADRHAEVLAILLDRCARNDAKKVAESA